MHIQLLPNANRLPMRSALQPSLQYLRASSRRILLILSTNFTQPGAKPPYSLHHQAQSFIYSTGACCELTDNPSRVADDAA